MTKKSTKQHKGSKHNSHEDPNALLDAIVQGIEASAKDLYEHAKKKGMTRAQAEELEKRGASFVEQLQQHGGSMQIPPLAQQEQYRLLMMAQREAEKRAWIDSRYVNVEMPLAQEYVQWMEAGNNRWVRFAQFDGSNEVMDDVVRLYDAELSEPYSSFTYQYFVYGWRDLCILAYGVESASKPAEEEKGEFIGAIVSRLSRKAPGSPLRGYIAMLAVKPTFRGSRIGSRLVEATVDLMRRKGGDVVALETPQPNLRALKLYTSLGFAKSKFLASYYLDGSDAFRLKLFLGNEKQKAEIAAAVAAVPPPLEPSVQQ
mmetsp:Transcript_10457/g.11938  ORF Transcript_10457/g.11938 Transcript_10457/m.11938 type:complete len:315 (+) Transcript_10457:53-997(+)